MVSRFVFSQFNVNFWRFLSFFSSQIRKLGSPDISAVEFLNQKKMDFSVSTFINVGKNKMSLLQRKSYHKHTSFQWVSRRKRSSFISVQIKGCVFEVIFWWQVSNRFCVGNKFQLSVSYIQSVFSLRGYITFYRKNCTLSFCQSTNGTPAFPLGNNFFALVDDVRFS